MEHNTKKTYVIRLGGSVIVPEKVDVIALTRIFNILKKRGSQKMGARFFVIVGGGATNRMYNSAAREYDPEISNDSLDWIGVRMIQFHAEFLKLMIGSEFSHNITFMSPEDIENLEDISSLITFCGAQSPGKSSNYSSVAFALRVGGAEVINISNVAYVHDKDPRKNPNAKSYKKITWADYRKLIPEKWTPKLSVPFDPVASRLAQEQGVRICFIHQEDAQSLEDILNGRNFNGTLIGSKETVER